MDFTPYLTSTWLALKAGGNEVITFLLGKAMGAFFPAFFIAGAMATLVPKKALVQPLSPKNGVARSYFFASISGAFLTVCSCSVLPLFHAFVERGVATGPAFTFLAATPAINPIAMFFAFTLIGPRFFVGKFVTAALMAVTVGMIMAKFFPLPAQPEEEEPAVFSLKRKIREPRHTALLFAILTAMVFVLPIGGLHWGFKIGWLFMGIVWLRHISKTYFEKEEIEAWIDKSLDLMKNILPMILLGIFATGVLKYAVDPDGQVVKFMRDGGFWTCLACSAFAGVSYMGSILCVSFTKGLLDLGLHDGAAMAILLSGPGVSLASLFGVAKSVGKVRSTVYFLLVMWFGAVGGWLFGLTPKW